MSEKITEQLTISGAYSRDYTSKAAAIADFRDGKDFQIHTPGHHQYCGVYNFAVGTPVSIRYKAMRQQTLYRVTGTEPGYANTD